MTELYISEHIRALERLVELIVARDDVEDVPLRVLMATPDGQTRPYPVTYQERYESPKSPQHVRQKRKTP